MGKRACCLLALGLVVVTAAVLQAAPAVARTTGSIRLVGATSPVVTGTRITLGGRFRYGGNRVYVLQRARPGTHEWTIVKGTKGRTTKRGYYRVTLRARWDFLYRALLLKTSTSPRRVSRAIRVDTKGWLQISADDDHTCGIWYDHTLWCWGDNSTGQLGNPTNNGSYDFSILQWVPNNTPNPAPTQVVDSAQNPGAPQTWRSVSVATGYTCGIRTDDTLWCWGSNSAGELGTGSADSIPMAHPVPLLVDDSFVNTTAPQTWLTVTAAGGLGHTCGIRTDHSLWCWGLNLYGELGSATSYPSGYPTPLLVDSNTWTSVSTPGHATCGVRTDQTLWCWGDNEYDQLGNAANQGTTNPNPTPLPVGSGIGIWRSVAGFGGGSHVCAIQTDHTLWCWGDNGYGQLGNSSSGPSYIPALVSAGYPYQAWRSSTAGVAHTCGLRGNHTLWCWGFNGQGELGNGTSNGIPNPDPVQVTTPAHYQTWLSVEAGGEDTCAIRSDHALYCWGVNLYGELGRTTALMGTQSPNPKPLRVPNPTS